MKLGLHRLRFDDVGLGDEVANRHRSEKPRDHQDDHGRSLYPSGPPPTVGGRGGRVFDEFELQNVDEEPNRGVVVMNHDRHKLKKSHRGWTAPL